MTKFVLLFVVMHLSTTGWTYRFVCVDDKNTIRESDFCDRRGQDDEYTHKGVYLVSARGGLLSNRMKGPKDEQFDADFPQFPEYKVQGNVQVSDLICTRSKEAFRLLDRRKANCKPRDAIFELIDDGALVSPRYLVLQRCQGLCKNKSCAAVGTVNRTIFVNVKTLEGTQLCKQVQVHDDTTCDCLCLKNCSSNEILDEGLCKCMCQDEMNLERQCFLKNARSGEHVWNSNECKCQCIEEFACSTGSEFDEDICACVKSWK